MKTNTSKQKSFYTQGKQCAARVLLIAGLLASYSPRNILAAPDSQLSMAPGVSPVEGNLSFQARAGERVRFHYQKDQWQAEVSSRKGAFSRRVVLPVVCSQGTDVSSSLEVLSNYPSWYSQRQIHVLDRNVCPTLGEVVYVGELGLKGGGNDPSKSTDDGGPDVGNENDGDADDRGSDVGNENDGDADDRGSDGGNADDGDADDRGSDGGNADDRGSDDRGSDGGNADDEDEDDEDADEWEL